MLADHFERQRFIQEIDQNFSVLAPAGVGKTQAIVERLVQLARTWGNRPHGKIAVVTYTQKAAQEMQERVEKALRSLPDRGMHFKSLAFFGTIHSLALMLLQQYGSLAGLCPKLQLLENSQAMWEAFCMETSFESIVQKIPYWEAAAPLISMREALEKSHALNRPLPTPPPIASYPNIDWRALDHWEPEKPSLKKGAEGTLQELKSFAEAYEKRLPFLTIPIPSKGGPGLIEAVEDLLKPLRDFIAQVWHHLLYTFQEKYRAYRYAKGQLTYDDMIHLALQIVDHPQIQKARFHVLLDEAQDTDTAQLHLLQNLAGLKGLQKNSTNESQEVRGFDFKNNPNGRLVLVGDPQQSIYGMRAHLSTYLNLHEILTSTELANELKFQVTFRCDAALIDTLNQLGPRLLSPSVHQENLQVHFQPLIARPDATTGKIERLALHPETPSEDPALYEAQVIAHFCLNSLRKEKTDLSQTAILCPRNEWLQVIAEAFQAHSIPYQLHARGKTHGEMAAFAWMLGILKSFYKPQDAFETVGLLRELFGISDTLLAEWVALSIKNPSYNIHPLSCLHEIHPLDSFEKFQALQDALQLLKEVYEATRSLGPRAALEVIYETLHIEERLRALPLTNLQQELDLMSQLLAEASAYECENKTTYDLLAAWELRQGQPLENQLIETGKIQLLSCHSAKGLEWETVILPYFFRPIGYKVDAYPQWLSYGETYGFRWDSAHNINPLEAWVKADRKAQQERLLYVALTRAKETLYIVEDPSLWEKTAYSFAETLKIQLGEDSHEAWKAIPKNELNDTPIDNQDPLIISEKQAPSISEDCPKISPEDWKNYPKRQLPSQPIEPEIILRAAVAKKSNSGTDYGNTWHTMMATCPWQKGSKAWASHFETWCPLFQDSTRAQKEIDIFLQSPLLPILEKFTPFIRTEVPFIWKQSPEIVFEGTIDLLAHNPETQEGWVLDWKTNRQVSLDDLRKIYINQINAYHAAITSRYKKSAIKKMLYATETGQMLEEF